MNIYDIWTANFINLQLDWETYVNWKQLTFKRNATNTWAVFCSINWWKQYEVKNNWVSLTPGMLTWWEFITLIFNSTTSVFDISPEIQTSVTYATNLVWLFKETIEISSAEILWAFEHPIELIPAPWVWKAINLKQIIIQYNAWTNAYTWWNILALHYDTNPVYSVLAYIVDTISSLRKHILNDIYENLKVEITTVDDMFIPAAALSWNWTAKIYVEYEIISL